MNSKKPASVGPGDIVIIHDDNMKRGMWKMGVVEEIVKGRDNQVRGAKVRKAGKGKPEVVTRPIQKLVLLESSNNNCEGMDDNQGEKKGMNGDVC